MLGPAGAPGHAHSGAGAPDGAAPPAAAAAAASAPRALPRPGGEPGAPSCPQPAPAPAAERELLLSHSTQEAIANQIASCMLAVRARVRTPARARDACTRALRLPRRAGVHTLARACGSAHARARPPHARALPPLPRQGVAWVAACRSAAVHACVKKAVRPIVIAAVCQYAALRALLAPINLMLRVVS